MKVRINIEFETVEKLTCEQVREAVPEKVMEEFVKDDFSGFERTREWKHLNVVVKYIEEEIK